MKLVNLRVPEESHAAWKKAAAKQGTDFSKWARAILDAAAAHKGVAAASKVTAEKMVELNAALSEREGQTETIRRKPRARPSARAQGGRGQVTDKNSGPKVSARSQSVAPGGKKSYEPDFKKEKGAK